MKKQIPNIITSGNILCGCLAVTAIAQDNLTAASLLVLLAAFFDFFDGLSARLLKVGSAIGAQLDSLADVISFGLVPAYLAYALLSSHSLPYGLTYLPFVMVAFSAYRLAKFNVDSRQSSSFIGFPTPANALFWVSIPLISWQEQAINSPLSADFMLEFFNNPIVLLMLCVLMSFLLVAEIPLLSLKFKSFKWSENKFRFTLIFISLALLCLFFFAAIPFILILYLAISLIENNLKKT